MPHESDQIASPGAEVRGLRFPLLEAGGLSVAHEDRERRILDDQRVGSGVELVGDERRVDAAGKLAAKPAALPRLAGKEQ